MKKLSLILSLFIIFFIVLSTPTIFASAPIVVDSLADVGSPGICTLRDAIQAANQDSAVNGCSAGSGADTISFSVSGTIVTNSQLILLSEIEIDGSGLITIEANHNWYMFFIPNDIGLITFESITLQNGTNTFANNGGAISNWDKTDINIFNSSLLNNFAEGYGGAIYNNEGNLTIQNSVIANNNSEDGGGGIYSYRGSLTIENSFINDNTSDGRGGGIHSGYGSLNITNSVIQGNSTLPNGISGGGLQSFEEHVIIDSSTFDSNSASSGGGIYLNEPLYAEISNSSISNNSAISQFGPSSGGGIDNSGNLKIHSTTITNNVADMGGGFRNSGDPLIINSTIHNNSSNINGGGILNERDFGLHTIEIFNSTISGNSAGNLGGNIFNDLFADIYLSNTIVANSISGGDCVNSSGTIYLYGNNIIEDNSCGASGGADPLLGPLSDNGCVQTHITPTGFSCVYTQSLLATSPAIDSADPSICGGVYVNDIDQRGVPRLGSNSLCDIGAFEGSLVPTAVSLDSAQITAPATKLATGGTLILTVFSILGLIARRRSTN